jgi:hypothetical protein
MEGLTKEIFNTEMEKLVTLYNYSATKEQMAIYYEYLSKIFNAQEFIEVCGDIPLKERFFPAVSVFYGSKKQPLMKKAF